MRECVHARVITCMWVDSLICIIAVTAQSPHPVLLTMDASQFRHSHTSNHTSIHALSVKAEKGRGMSKTEIEEEEDTEELLMQVDQVAPYVCLSIIFACWVCVCVSSQSKDRLLFADFGFAMTVGRIWLGTNQETLKHWRRSPFFFCICKETALRRPANRTRARYPHMKHTNKSFTHMQCVMSHV